MNLTKLTRWSVVLAVAILVAGLSVDPPAAVGKQGNGQGEGGNNAVPVIAVFQDSIVVEDVDVFFKIENSEQPIKQNELQGNATSHFMPAGHYVTQLGLTKRGKRVNPKLRLHFDDMIPPECPPDCPMPGPLNLIEASPSMTVHAITCVPDTDCAEQVALPGGLRDMKPGRQTAAAVNIWNIEDPFGIEYRVLCGAIPGGTPDPPPFPPATDLMTAECVHQTNDDTEGPCDQWQVFSTDTNGDGSPLTCRVYRVGEVNEAGEWVGDYNMDFRLHLCRDSDGDGTSDHPDGPCP